MKKSIVWLSLGVLVLGGCATAITPKPTLSERQYSSYGWEFTLLHYCPTHDYMTPETASLGRAYLLNVLTQFQVDEDKFKRELAYINQYRPAPTKDQCVVLAMHVADQQRQLAQQKEEAEYRSKELNELSKELANSFKTKQTSCTKIGEQVFCSSY